MSLLRYLLQRAAHIGWLLVLLSIGAHAETESAIDLGQWQQLTDQDPAAAIDKIRARLQTGGDTPSSRLALLLMQTEATGALGNQAEYRRLAETGLNEAHGLGDAVMAVRFKVSLADALSQHGDWEDARQRYEECLRDLAGINDVRVHGLVYMMYGLSHYYRGNHDEALRLSTRAYELLAPIQAPEVPTVLNNIALAYDATGDFDQALAYFQRSLDYLDQSKEASRASVTLYNMGFVSLRKGDLDAAESYLKKAIVLAEQSSTAQTVAFANGQLGLLEFKRGQFDAARPYTERALALAKQLGNARLERISLFQLIDIAWQKRDRTAVNALLTQVTPMIESSNNDGRQRLLEAQARAAALNGDNTGAVLAYEQALEQLKTDKNEEKARINAELKGRFDTTVQEKENEILRQKNELQALTLSQQTSQKQSALLLAALLIGISTLLAVLGYREKKNRQRMANLALTDELTGVANRRRITELAQDELARFQRQPLPVCFAMLDIDHFKRLNDEFGHDVGDRVLRQFAIAVRDHIRITDRFGRFGGEEWLLLMPQTEPGDIEHIYRRIADACLHITLPNPERKLTFSMGVTMPHAIDTDLDTVLKRADEALYQAKAEGRARACFRAASVATTAGTKSSADTVA